MANWAESLFATAFGEQWTASTMGQAHEVPLDASCTQPQMIGFEDDNDDLFADSDAP